MVQVAKEITKEQVEKVHEALAICAGLTDALQAFDVHPAEIYPDRHPMEIILSVAKATAIIAEHQTDEERERQVKDLYKKYMDVILEVADVRKVS